MVQYNIDLNDKTILVTGAAGFLPADYDFEAHKELVPMQAGDVPITYADTNHSFGARLRLQALHAIKGRLAEVCGVVCQLL